MQPDLFSSLSGAGPLPAPLTPVQAVALPCGGRAHVKRDDLLSTHGVLGGKGRTLAALADGASGLVVYAARESPQPARAARLCRELGLPCRVHVPAGAGTESVAQAEADGATVIRHRPGYLSVLSARAREDAARTGLRLVPFGGLSRAAAEALAPQVRNVPEDAGRLVVPLGSGTTLAGVLLGRQTYGRRWPVLAVRVGHDPSRSLDALVPGWRALCAVTDAPEAYAEAGDGELPGVPLHPNYEAKCVRHLRPGDCLWVVGSAQAVEAEAVEPEAVEKNGGGLDPL